MRRAPALPIAGAWVNLFGDGQRCGGWRLRRRPMRRERTISAFLDLVDQAEQEELAHHTLAARSVDELRRAFRERLSAGL